MTTTVLPFQRRNICEACRRPLITPFAHFWLCGPCDEEYQAQEWARWDAEARALGFASADERMEFEMRQPEATP